MILKKSRPEDIRRFLSETSYVLCLESADDVEEGLEGLCGLLNTEAAKGVLLFGMAGGRGIRGIATAELDPLQECLQRRIGGFNPVVFPRIEVLKVDVHEDAFLVQVSAERGREVELYEYNGSAFLRDGAVTRMLNPGEKKRLIGRRRRDFHSGPLRCDRCRRVVDEAPGVHITEWGIQKAYRCPCGGEFFPV